LGKAEINVIQILGDPAGGIRKHVHEVVASGREYGFCISYAHGATLDLMGKIDVKKFDSYGINRIQMNIPKKPHLSDILNIYRLFFYCRLKRINVVHGHGAKGGIYARVLGFMLKIPSVYTPHGGSLHSNFSWAERILYSSVEYFLRPITSFYLFESDYTLKRFLDSCGFLSNKKYSVNHNGINANLFSSQHLWSDGLNQRVNILVVGVLREMKGQAIAIEALAKLKKYSKIPIHLDLCGAGPSYNELKLLCSKLSLIDNVTFHGDVEDVASYYEKSNIVVIPSLFESFGYVAVEAALMSRPVVASNCGGLNEVINDNETGFLFLTGSPCSLAKKIETVIQDINKTNQVVSNAKIHAEINFTTKSMLDNIYSAYLQLVVK
jgi:glycosyltransferase involved in cell wall biosynthesis